jgi:hypothetical protein
MTMAWTKTENGYIAPATDGGSYRVWKSLRDDVPPTNPQFEWIGQRWPPAEPPGRYVRQLYKGLLKGAAMPGGRYPDRAAGPLGDVHAGARPGGAGVDPDAG